MTAYQGQPKDDRYRGIESVRQDAIDRLTAAFASDAITMDEYERRATAATAATRIEELERLSFDLPAVKGAEGRRERGRAQEPRTGARNRTDNSLVGAAPMTTGCVMGDRNLTGNWLSSDRVSSFTVMGSTKLDLRDADLPPGPIRIEAFTLMGETKVIVPRGLPVRLNAFAFMGESRAGREVDQQILGAPTWVEISGFAMMGSVTVRAMD
ncbi:MAG: cell wall-active antibiotics response protein [Spirochaetes bacterium]|nr:cell wall-active antibiotics response protein [Spirochaetota bacterium]MBU1079377.1 cell wall-active antibiotics response protein [Spirochaetota bacterium]